MSLARNWRGAAVALAVLLLPAAALSDTRLDPRVAPVFQAVDLNIDARTEDYTGKVIIDLDVKEKTDTFLFHAEEMELDSVELTGKDGPVKVTVEEIEERGVRRATASQPLDKGRYQLTIAFHKPFNTKAVGLYRMEYEGAGYLFTQFEAIDARKAFPCWDEPLFKIPFQISLTIPMTHEAITNTPLEKEVMGASTKTYHFKRTPPMPTYLIAIAAGPLESVAISGLSVPGRVYTCKGQKKLAKVATEVTPGILAALEEYFDRPYPYEKLDLVAIPEYWPGAMENPGAVTYRDNILLIDPDAASVSQRRLLYRVTAHELAHMWFGDLVTMAWWDDLWLNESFADWMGDKITDQLFPELEWGMAALRDVDQTKQQDARTTTVPIRREVVSAADMSEDMGLAYEKGKTLLRMVEVWIGEDHFQEGVRHYINKFAWKNARAADLFNALSSASGTDIEPILSSYLDQSGYPLVSVDVKDNGVIELSQERFANYGVDAKPQMWSTPVHLKYSDGEQILTRSLLLDKESEQIELSSNVEWVMPDAGAIGYYRWVVPPSMLFQIAENPTETLTARERAAFLGNAKALVLAGALGGDDYLAVLSRFAKDPDPTTMNKIIDDLGSVQAAFVTDDLKESFALYIRQTLGPALDAIGLDGHDGEAEAASLLRPRLIAWLGDEGGDETVRNHCVDMARRYLESPTSVDASLAGVALRIAAIDGDKEQFDRYREKYESSKVPADKARYLRALGSFADPKLQDEALEYALTDAVRPNDTYRVIGGISSTEAGREKVFQWMMKNYDRMTARIPPEYAAYMPYFVSGCSEERLAAARKFFAEPGHSVEGTDRNLNKVSEGVADCVNLREREGDRVADFLHQLVMR